MSFAAILNSSSSLRELLKAGDRPAVVATWSSAVYELAKAQGIPVLHEDDVIDHDDRLALHDRINTIIHALSGDEIPTSRSYPDWCWWALEPVLNRALSHAQRTQRLLEACEAVAPGYRTVVHDRETLVQGAVTNFLAARAGLNTFGFEAIRGERDTLHQRLDYVALPKPAATVVDRWQGKRMPKDSRPGVILIHSNEVAHLVPSLVALGEPWFCLMQDPRMAWPKELIGPTVDARPAGSRNEMLDVTFPRHLQLGTEAWEEELAEALAMTWQASLREAYGWSRAAYEAGRIGVLLGGSTYFPETRTRILAAQDLGIKVVITQHGMLHSRPGELVPRAHHFADNNLCWSRLSANDIRGYGARGAFDVVGWPQSSIEHAQSARAYSAARTDRTPSATDRPWVVLTSAPSPEEPYGWGETFLKDALEVIRAVDPTGRIVIKHHPFQEPAIIVRTLCARWKITNVEVVGGLDPWVAVQEARAVIAYKSTSVQCALHQDIPVIIYHPAERDAMFDRWPGFPIVRTRADLEAALRAGEWPADYTGARSYTRIDVHAGHRAVSVLRRVLHGSRAERLRRRRKVRSVA